MLDTLPIFSELFGLTPAVFWALTGDEYDAYSRRVDQLAEQASRAAHG